ncbi:tRNA lysidine(34) synthetase TilS [Shewanella sp. CG12_big_fil_rev_8_21_14_0_65_47_15]|uniref:tRNA lysidine(34) synthetase TilS n=1 Tax=Shewanella sp. CG12_big_fil_rev_8_21_14_0_65_47_15 TaxID=1975537 RepID=UPI000CB04648|nr:tRNA lysidine(34) synthetase TilS [Shewanella sp. CG12_big_fil_rev_8_21_14_0_65_47_15]PIW61062.1 MAG: tRNA lysidine(34) synthetase TilS [Shewanella sp. CG12_big_fil_rev_8_21_14_0_65_47_15]
MSFPDLCAHISTFLDSLRVKAGCQLVLAYSGGVDSEVLAFGLAEYAKQHSEFRYQLIYVHHGLSPNADDWAQHCLTRGSFYGLPVTVEHVTLHLGSRVSVEAEARRARYLAIEQHLGADDYLLTAHHEDDQLETILLALKRGQGPKGLAAMGQIQPLAKGTQVRPLLDVSRSQIEAFAKAQGLVHIEDESNQDDKFDRNFLRLEIIPRLKSRWPSIATTASRSAFLCAEQQALVNEVVGEHLPQWLTKATFSQQTVLNLEGFAAQTPRWQSLLLRGFIESQGFALPSLVQLNQIIYQLLSAKEDAKVQIRIGDCELRRFANQLYVSSFMPPNKFIKTRIVIPHDSLNPLIRGESDSLCIALPQGGPLQLRLSSSGPRLRLPMSDEVVSVRYQLPGQLRCHPHYRSRGRELKKLLQESAVPPWLRGQLGFLFYGEQLVMAQGLWIEKAFCVAGDGVGIVFG